MAEEPRVEDTDSQAGLRERKKRETRTALSRVAIGLCLERGWNEVTIRDVAAAAGVSERTFRNYFSTKAEAVAAAHVERIVRVADALRAEESPGDLLAALRPGFLREFVPGGARVEVNDPVATRWRDSMQVLLSEPGLHGEVAKADAIARRALAAAIAENLGVGHTEFRPQLMAATVLAAVSTALEASMNSTMPVDIETGINAAFDLLESGLG